MKDYEIILWCLNEEKNAPLGAGYYYPLMLRILMNNGYIKKEYLKDNSLSFFDYVIFETYLKNNIFTLSGYYKQTLKVIKTFDRLYEEDKDKAMNMKSEDFIKLIKEEGK